jgi:hypothetical protein
VGAIIALLLALLPAQTPAAAQGDAAKVRFAAVLGDITPLDFYIDGEFQAGNTNGFTGYFDVAPGDHVFSFRAVYGAEDLGTASATLAAGQYITVAALNSTSALQPVVMEDVITAPARWAAHVKVLNAGIEAPPVTVTVGETVLASDLAFGQVSATQQIYAGKKDITVNTSPNTDKHAREHFQVLTHKRLIDIVSPTNKTIDALMHLELPAGVGIEIKS